MKLALLSVLLLTSAAFAADPVVGDVLKASKPAQSVVLPAATAMPAADVLKFASIGKPGPGTTSNTACDACMSNPLDLWDCLCCEFPYFCGSGENVKASSCSKAPPGR